MRDYRGAGGLAKMQKALLAGNANNETYQILMIRVESLLKKLKKQLLKQSS
jgi:hypothetical protein